MNIFYTADKHLHSHGQSHRRSTRFPIILQELDSFVNQIHIVHYIYELDLLDF